MKAPMVTAKALLLLSQLLLPSSHLRVLAFVLPPPQRAIQLSWRPAIGAGGGGEDGGDSSASPPSAASTTTTTTSADEDISKAPTLNGRAVLPVKAMTAGLKGHKVAAVYAILDSGYKRGSGEGWDRVLHVGVTRDLASDISRISKEMGSDAVAHVRAMSFSYPQRAAMEDFADGWRARVCEAGGDLGRGEGLKESAAGAAASATTTTTEGSSTILTVGDDYEFDEEDEDMDEDDLDDYLQMMAEARVAVSPPAPAPLFVDNTGLSNIVSLANDKAGGARPPNASSDTIVSPFESSTAASTTQSAAVVPEEEEPLDLTIENVDKVLDEVRPYLVSDGGNVSIQNVDDQTGNVFLLLEGACGSCASSTVTMKMGIERVLKEKFGDKLGEVLQVEPENGEGGAPTELTVEAVQAEVDRMSNAIVAMGGVVRVLGVDPETGVAEVDFRGPNRVRKGLEMALLDVEFVRHVKFVSLA